MASTNLRVVLHKNVYIVRRLLSKVKTRGEGGWGGKKTVCAHQLWEREDATHSAAAGGGGEVRRERREDSLNTIQT